MRCYNCEEEITEGEQVLSPLNEEYYCEDCYYDSHVECTECGDVVWRDSAYYDYDSENWYCSSCWNDLEESRNAINGYHDFSDSGEEWEILTGSNEVDSDSLMKTGFELEVQATNDNLNETARYLRENFSDIIQDIEHDGSVSNGFEIITKPFTKKAKEEYVGSKIKEMTEYLTSQGFKSHNTNCCGLHVHTTRSAYGENDKVQEENISRLILFTEFYKEQLKAFSRRSNFHYCNFTSEYDHNSIDAMYLKSSKILKDLNYNYDRYQVVNTENSNTIELRVFRGTLKFETLMATLDFVYELTDEIINKKNYQISWDKIVRNSKSEYLKNYCEERQIFNSQKLTDESANIDKILKIKKDNVNKYYKVYNAILVDTIGKIREIQKMINLDNLDIKTNKDLIQSLISLNITLDQTIRSNVQDIRTPNFEYSSDLDILKYKVSSLYSNYERINSNLDYISMYMISDEILDKITNLRKYIQENLTKINELQENYNNNNGNGEE